MRTHRPTKLKNNNKNNNIWCCLIKRIVHAYYRLAYTSNMHMLRKQYYQTCNQYKWGRHFFNTHCCHNTHWKKKREKTVTKWQSTPTNHHIHPTKTVYCVKWSVVKICVSFLLSSWSELNPIPSASYPLVNFGLVIFFFFACFKPLSLTHLKYSMWNHKQLATIGWCCHRFFPLCSPRAQSNQCRSTWFRVYYIIR